MTSSKKANVFFFLLKLAPETLEIPEPVLESLEAVAAMGEVPLKMALGWFFCCSAGDYSSPHEGRALIVSLGS